MKKGRLVSKGDEFMQQRTLFLYHLFEAAATDPTRPVDALDLWEAIKETTTIDEQDLRSLYRNLSKAGLVKKTGSWWRTGEGRRGKVRLWLTPDGVKNASAISGEVLEHIERASKGRMGFQVPGDSR